VSRILFVVPPLAGHVNPTAAVGAELIARGHDVAWAGHPATITPLLPAGARVFPAIDDAAGEQLRAGRERWLDLRGAAALKFFWEDFVIPLAGAMLPGTREAIAAHRPDVIISDQQALAGAVAARLTGIPWVTCASTSAELLRPLAGMPRVEEWISDQMAAFQLINGVVDPVDLRFSDRLTLVLTTPALMGDISGFSSPDSFWDHCAFTGPALTRRPDRGDFPWEWLDPGREHVLVSLGTLNGPAGERFFRVATEALSGLGDRLQAVIVGPPVPGAPDHLLFTGHVPQLALLPHMNAVVSHGGHNTVCESLAGGLPLVVTPIRDDQPLVAQQVADAGAGIRLRFGRLRPAELRDAVVTILSYPSYRTAAARIGDSFTAAGGAATAADHVEKLL
jgi:MGT family glycosyltransferase